MSVEDKNQSQEQPKQEAIEDIDLEKMADNQVTLLGWENNGTAEPNDIKKSFIAGYKAALLSQQQPEHTSSELITAQVHEIDSLRITNRELWEKIESDAVEFGEWIDKDYANYGNHGKYSWSKKFPNQNTMIQVTTKELYKLFKNKQ